MSTTEFSHRDHLENSLSWSSRCVLVCYCLLWKKGSHDITLLACFIGLTIGMMKVVPESKMLLLKWKRCYTYNSENSISRLLLCCQLILFLATIRTFFSLAGYLRMMFCITIASFHTICFCTVCVVLFCALPHDFSACVEMWMGKEEGGE